jgi:hypothetical protein
MNFEMTGTQVRQHVNEISHQVARCRGRSAGQPAATHAASGPSGHAPAQPGSTRPSGHAPAQPAGSTRPGRTGLRKRLGVTLIEAGLHLLAADGPQAGG